MRNSNQPAEYDIRGSAWVNWDSLEPAAERTTGERAVAEARADLIRTLQNAYSGELGAILAYRGHWKSVSDPTEKERIHRIEVEEICHRERVGEMLIEMGETPQFRMDHIMGWVGSTLGRLCQWSGWFAPMYGAGLLESRNIREYEEAAQYALGAGLHEYLDDLLTMAEVEWEHEKFFREKCRSHFLYHWFPKWKIPPALHTIRKPFTGSAYPEGRLRHILL